MGQSESADLEKPQRYEIRSLDKAPAKMVVEKPKITEGHSVLQVPHTNIKILHVDPVARAGIVPQHGYIALQVVPPEDRGDDWGGDASGDGSRKRRRKGSLGPGGGDAAAEDSFGAFVTEASMDPELQALLQQARAEYREEEHTAVQREVRTWKTTFSVNNGRAPNKKDISNDPYMFQQYYRLKELDAMKKLLDENERVEVEAVHQVPELVRDLTELEVARAEFNALELLDLNRDVKLWKSEFKKVHGRAPTKRDVAEDAGIYAKYYRVKELETMKKLIDEADTMAPGDGAMSGAAFGFADEGSAAAGWSARFTGGSDAVDAAMTQFDPEEYRALTIEVKEWKKAFRDARGRPPTKKDIAEDPVIFTKYYREKELETMKKLIEEADSMVRRASVIGVDEALIRAQNDYNAVEHEALAREVKGWKAQFKAHNGRPPNKRDVAEDPNIFAAYYREKELAAMKELLDGERTAGDSGRPTKSHRAEHGATTTMDAAGGPAFPSGALSFTAVENSMGGGDAREDDDHEAGGASATSGAEGGAVGQGGYREKKPPPLLPLGASSSAAQKTKQTSDKQLPAAAGAEGPPPSTVAIETRFVCPRGHQAAERVFFFDAALQLDARAQAALNRPQHTDPVAAADHYALEEDEIYEMAGVRRPLETHVDEDDDPLATYEAQSNVLEALRLAIDAPMDDFVFQNDVTYDEGLQDFMQQAMHDAHALFEDARTQDTAFQKTYSVAAMSHAKSGLGRRLMSKVKSRINTMHQITAFDDGAAATGAPGTLAVEDDEYAGWSHEDMVRERKRLHKQLNKYKEEFFERQGRAPEAFEMAQDMSIRDAFAQYHKLKKRTKTEAVADAALSVMAEMGQQQQHHHYYGNGEPAEDETAAANAEGMATTQEDEQQPPQFHTHLIGARVASGFNPFAKVLEDKNLEEQARRQRALAPIAEPAAALSAEERDAAAAAAAEEHELDILGKEVKIWKRGFKEREGRNPTRKDIKADPEFFAKYARVKELEEKLGVSSHKSKRDLREGLDEEVGGAGDGGYESQQHVETADEASPPSARKKHHRADAPRQAQDEVDYRGHIGEDETYRLVDEEETQQEGEGLGVGAALASMEIGHVVSGEEINRRDVEADEGIDFRMLMNHAMAVGLLRKSGAAELSSTSETSAAFELANNNTNNQNSNSSLATLRAGDDARRAELGATRGGASSAEPILLDHGTGGSTTAAGDRAKAAAGVGPQTGWTFPAEGDEEVDEGTTFDGAKVADSEFPAALSLDEKRERRKEVSKELNLWKNHFKMVQGKAPTSKDIAENVHVKALYDEYQALQKTIETEEKKLQLQEKRSMRDKKKSNMPGHAKGAISGATPTEAAAGVSPSREKVVAESPIARTVDHQDSDSYAHNPVESAKHRRDELAKQFSEWFTEFTAREGRAATLKDLSSDEPISHLYEAYYKCTDVIATAEGGTGALGTVDPNEVVATAIHRKHIGRKLNEWKANFSETYGRNPAVRDIKTDKHASALYDEYSLIPKQTEDDAVKILEQFATEQQSSAEAQWQILKARKKELTKVLNEWKKHFTDTHGHKPKVSDIVADPVVAAVYQEFQEVHAAVERGGSTQAGAGGEGNPLTQSSDNHQGRGTNPGAPSAAGGDTTLFNWAGGLSHSPEPEEGGASPLLAQPAVDKREGDAKRKKRVTKQLNQWKAAFREREGRNPTKSDIRQDAEAQALFDEYQALKSKLEHAGAGGAGDEEDHEPETHDKTEEVPSDGQATRAVEVAVVATPGDTTIHNGDSPSAHPEASPPLLPTTGPHSVPSETEHEDRASRKKRAAKELNQWKTAFREREGRNPTKSDIRKDADAQRLYDEYQALKEKDAGGAAEEDTTTADDKTRLGVADNLDVSPALSGRQSPYHPTEAEANAATTATNSNHPASGAVTPTAAAALSEPSNTTTPVPTNSAAGADEGDPITTATDLKSRKKQLNKRLNAWKSAFAETNGRQPKQHDIQADPEMMALYDELKQVKAALKDDEGAGGRDGQDGQ